MRRKFCPVCTVEAGSHLSECICGFVAGPTSLKWDWEQDSSSLEHNLNEIRKKPKYEGVCGYCGFVQLSEQKIKCNACGMKTNQKRVRYSDSNFSNSFKKFDKIPRLRIKNILSGIDVDQGFYTLNAKFIKKLAIELPEIERAEERKRKEAIEEAEDLKRRKQEEKLQREAQREKERLDAVEADRIWNLPENVEKRRLADEEHRISLRKLKEKENKLTSERQDNLRAHGVMLTNAEMEQRFQLIEEKKAQREDLIKEILKHRSKSTHYSDRFDWSKHHDNIPLLNDLCGDKYRRLFLKSVAFNHSKYQYHGDKLVSSYKKMLERIKKNCHGKDDFNLISSL